MSRFNLWKIRVKALMNKGMSQAAIARRTKTSTSLISLIAKGERGEQITYDAGVEIVKLCRDLGIKL